MDCVPLSHFSCPYLESMEEIKAVSGDLNTSICSQSFLQAVCLPTNFIHMNIMSDDGMGRIWVDSPACDTRLLHTTPQQTRAVWPDTLILSRRGEEAKLSAFQIYQLTHFSSEKQAQREGILQRTFFASSDFSLITCQGSASFSQ